VIGILLVVVLCGAWLCDGAHISFRTADNFINGYGLAWNVKKRTQAYTHPEYGDQFDHHAVVSMRPTGSPAASLACTSFCVDKVYWRARGV
jgi:hypothetical protein